MPRQVHEPVGAAISPHVAAHLAKPGSHAGTMQRRVLRLLLEHEAAGQIPTNGRFVFYELEQRGVVRKSRQGESRYGGANDPREQDVINALSELRKRGVVPWEWIVDETRNLHQWQYAPTVLDYVRDSVAYARINPWHGDPPLLLVESRSLAGVLYSLASEYLCPIAATNGQVGGFLHTDIVPALRRSHRSVLYLGDWDLAGHQIEENTRLVLEKETGRLIDWTRIAITQPQIDERGLEPAWKTDSRYHPPKTHYAWETEALGQGTIQQLVRDELDWLLPEPLEHVLEKERMQRRRVAEILDEGTS